MSGDAPTVLVLDYTGHRAEAPISCIPLESHGFDVHYLLGGVPVRELTGPAYARRLLEQLTGPVPDVTAVLAYCMAAPIAQDLVHLLAADGRPPIPLVLFDGEPATPAAVREQFLAVATEIGQGLGVRPGHELAEEMFTATLLCHQPSRTVDWMRQRLLSLSTKAIGEADEDAMAVSAALTEFCLDWLTHLIAAHNASWPPWGGEVLHVVSRDHAMRDPWPGAKSTTIHPVDAPRAELLQATETAEATLSFLAR